MFTGVRFLPWQGLSYQKGWRGTRVLILGEAHYEWGQDYELGPDFTQICVREQIEGRSTKQFWTNIVVAFLGRRPELEEKVQFWNSVAFYNFIQSPVGFGARVAPSEELWKEGAEPFAEVLRVLRPEVLIALGYRLWH